jgi:hypothetical protein
MNDFSLARWRKSSHSHGGSGDCVEIAVAPSKLGVRDSKHPSGPVLVLRRNDAAALFAGIRAGRYDL